LRLRALSIIPIAIISMLAAGTTSAAAASPEAPVNLGSASNFTVLSKSGITDVFKTSINGNVGTSPITRTPDMVGKFLGGQGWVLTS